MFPRPRYVFLDDRALDDRGMATVEYSVCLLVGAALAIILLDIVHSGSVKDGLAGLIDDALSFRG